MIPTVALLMRSDAAACRDTAATLRDLGLAVDECRDACHLYALALGQASARSRESFVILAEPVPAVLRDLETLRGAGWRTPLVLVGRDARAEVARSLRAAHIGAAHPTARTLRRAIEAAVALVGDAAVVMPRSSS